MNAKNAIVGHPKTLAPEVGHLLNPQTRTVTKPADSRSFDTESLNVRAKTVTVVLEEILEQKGHIHGGINE